MSLFKKGKRGIWHYDFAFKGRRYQGSTDQSNINKAKLVEAKIRSDASLQLHNLIPAKSAPMFKDFLEGAFMVDVRKHAKKPRSVGFYQEHVKRLLKHGPFLNLRLNQVDEEAIAGYSPKSAIATINGDLRTLRKALNLALEWRLIQRKVKVRILPGEHQREFVVSPDLEALYLSVTAYPLKQAAILILDLGLRPEEAVTLCKEDITDSGVHVGHSKTPAGVRILPHTERTLEATSLLFALFPDSPYLFPGRKGGHFRRRSLDNLHAKTCREHNLPKEFVLYSMRHSFATRLAESGATPFEIMAALGHSSVTVSQRYVHLSSDHLRLAMKRKEAMDKMLRGEAHEETSTKFKTS